MAEPTGEPTAEPTPAPTAEPTSAPTAGPTATPTAAPSAGPTPLPSAAPSAEATPASALDIGAEVRLKAGVLAAEDACKPTNDRGAVVEIDEPKESQPLTMALVAPAEIGTCRELVLEGVAEGGTAGRPVTWVWDSSEDFEFTATSEVRLGDAALAPHYGSTISFECCATNWLGDEACVTQKVEVLDEPAPTVVVEGGDVSGASDQPLLIEHEDTLRASNNYADSLVNLERFKEARSTLRKMIPVARRVLGDHRLTLKMRKAYGEALYGDADATLVDLREAVTTLEDAARIARRVLGSDHPVTTGMEKSLRQARTALHVRETPPPGSA